MTRANASIIKTEILASDELEYRAFLKDNGFTSAELFASSKHPYLNIYFENPADYMIYALRGLEQRFMSSRSHVYYYDLEDYIDDLEDIFGDENH